MNWRYYVEEWAYRLIMVAMFVAQIALGLSLAFAGAMLLAGCGHYQPPGGDLWRMVN